MPLHHARLLQDSTLKNPYRVLRKVHHTSEQNIIFREESGKGKNTTLYLLSILVQLHSQLSDILSLRSVSPHAVPNTHMLMMIKIIPANVAGYN